MLKYRQTVHVTHAMDCTARLELKAEINIFRKEWPSSFLISILAYLGD
jgi:hypothetical protein